MMSLLTLSGHFSYDRCIEILAEPTAFVGVPAPSLPFCGVGWLDLQVITPFRNDERMPGNRRMG
jgi:hypothetical protein